MTNFPDSPILHKRHFEHMGTTGKFSLLLICLLLSQGCSENKNGLIINTRNYFEKRGVNVLVFSNGYNGLFSDSKISGVEIIHHDVRTATNGDVRLIPPGKKGVVIEWYVEAREMLHEMK